MTEIFNSYLYQPILAILIFIYKNFAFHDFGLAIIIFTLLVRVIFFPIFYKGAKDQALMQYLQPQIRKIQKDYKNDKEKQAKELFALYQKHNFNPFSGFFLLVIQLPILIAIYQIFVKELNNSAFDNLYFLGLINLGERNLILVVLTAFFQYFLAKISLFSSKNFSQQQQEKEDSVYFSLSKDFNKITVLLGPVLTVIILAVLPSALALYWLVSTVFSIFQQVFIINKKVNQYQAK